MRILANRKIDPYANQSPFQFFRWLDIDGPSDDGDEELYLRRLYVVRTRWFGVMVHWIEREDFDRDSLHDHPWAFWRLILSGGYTETLAWPVDRTNLSPEIAVEHKWMRFSKFPTGAYHRIASVKPHTVSLVVTGPKDNSWGFFVPGEGKVRWKTYLESKRPEKGKP